VVNIVRFCPVFWGVFGFVCWLGLPFILNIVAY